jgi:hypothetical protein
MVNGVLPARDVRPLRDAARFRGSTQDGEGTFHNGQLTSERFAYHCF